MCGIIGYIGAKDVPGLLVDVLKRLEYRGYDSCGVGLLHNGSAAVLRVAGSVTKLEQVVRQRAMPTGSACGIGHTRWATHGQATENNAHPHPDCTGRFLVVHNGIIENYLDLKKELASRGHRFRSDTDTEVLPHLIESEFRGNLEEAVGAALRKVEGAYAIVAVSSADSQKLVAARRGAPLVVGCGDGENLVSSDAASILAYTRKMIFLEDGDLAVVRRNSIDIRSPGGASPPRQPWEVAWSAEMAEKGGYAHFMLKEIHEQPRAVEDTLRGRVTRDGALTLDGELSALDRLSKLERLHLVACGTSLYAALAARFMLEPLCRIPVDVDYASEFRYRQPLLGPNSLVVGITQSGETADTLGALSEARACGAQTLAICNVVGSSAARNADCVFYTRAGPEIGVAATKTFTAQLAVLYLLALHLGRLRGTVSEADVRSRTLNLTRIPAQMSEILHDGQGLAPLAARLVAQPSALYLGRGILYPIALEGALKLKEISYIHAEGYPAGEMKHGPIALIGRDTPVVILASRGHNYAKTLGNLEEVKGRGAFVVAVATAGDESIALRSDAAAFIPATDDLLNPLLSAIPLQLLAYHAAVLKGCDVDRPRNLAKTVTVE